MGLSELTGRFRREEHTGANRCLPCTVVNGGIAASGAIVLWVLVSPWAGAVALTGAALLIYFRGYLVPGTPELTRRYFPPWVLRLFGKDPVDTGPVAGPPERGGGDGRPLVDGGILEPGDAEPALTRSFREAWLDRTASVLEDGVGPEAVARAFGAEEASQLNGTSFVLDGNRSVRWESEPALAADVAGAALLAERVSDWKAFDHDRRRRTLRALRLSFARCPNCGAGITVDTERVDPCCQKPHLVAESVCGACGTAVADAAVVDTGDIDSVGAALLDR